MPIREKKPNLVEIFLQFAASLKKSGSPIPFWDQAKSDADRIEKSYIQKFGNNPIVYHPALLADDYANRAQKNWETLSPKLGLDPLARNIGALLESAVTNPAVVASLNKHGKLVLASMTTDGNELEAFLKFKAAVLSSPLGNECSAVGNAVTNLFQRLDAGLKPEDAAKVKAAISSMFSESAEAVLFEFELDMESSAIEQDIPLHRNEKQRAHIPASYNPAQETRLTADELQIFESLYLKHAFTKADFPILEKFYSAAYDKLSDTGKAALHERIQAGISGD